MKLFNEYNHEEIETIAEKFSNNEFVTKEELTLWYDYKNAVKSYISDGEFWENHKHQDHEIVQEILAEIRQARNELRWMRTITTFPLQEFCDYYCKRNYEDETRITYVMADKVNSNEASETEKAFIREYFEESETLKSINHFRNVTTPVNLRNWTLNFNPATEYHPTETAMDGTQIYDGREHYVYIYKNCRQHRWGDTYWISIDCDNSLYSLPVIKDFKNYEFEIGKFYKIKCVDEIHFGGNKKKYVMDIQESTEEEFMTKGLHQYATRW